MQALKLVNTLKSKLAASTAATSALAQDQGAIETLISFLFLEPLAKIIHFVFFMINCFSALLAASLEKLNAREKELLDSKVR
jgi:hypothetical protein